ncbi:MAG: META domain-containing protein [Patescibacteria group bacterium]
MTSKNFLWVAVILLALGVLVYLFTGYGKPDSREATVGSDPKNATYLISGAPVTLVNEVAESEAAPGSGSKVVTRYFGNEVMVDLNDDGREDTVFLLTQETGGSGTFFYAVAALNTADGYVGSHAVFLGDRIAPQTTERGEGKIVIVNYADRAPGEPMSTPPSVGKSLYLKYDPATSSFGEVVQDFEGEADPSRMTLGMTTWKWLSATRGDGVKVRLTKEGAFTLTFNDGRLSASTDCNAMGGSYTATAGGALTFGPMMSTKMYCEGSQEGDFAALLQSAESFRFTSRGELILELADGGSMIFR